VNRYRRAATHLLGEPRWTWRLDIQRPVALLFPEGVQEANNIK